MTYEKTNWTSTTPINPINLNNIENGIEQNSNDINNMVNIIYPVGSIYMSINDVNPSTLFGGTWEQIKDTFLLSAGDTYEAGATGGEATHTLTTGEMPSHKHDLKAASDTSFSDNSSYPYLLSSAKRGFINGSTQDLYSYGYEAKATGGGEAHNNMPPYLTVYMWKRTA